MGTAVGEKGPTGRRPFRWERARPCAEETLRSRGWLVERPTSKRRARGDTRGGEDLLSGHTEGEPERLRGPREQKPPTRRKRLGSKEGDGSVGGIKSLERRREAYKVLRQSAGTERGEGTLPRSQTGRKALKGEAQGCWGLKEASEG